MVTKATNVPVVDVNFVNKVTTSPVGGVVTKVSSVPTISVILFTKVTSVPVVNAAMVTRITSVPTPR